MIFFANWTILSQKKKISENFFWPFFRILSPPKSPRNENFEKMKKTTPDIFIKYQKNPQTHILDKLASRECAPTDAKKWDRHTYIHSGLLDSTEVENTNNHGNPFSRFLDINNNPPSGYLSTHEYYSRLNGSRKKVIETKKNDNSLQHKQVISQNNMNNYSINIIPSNSLFQESHTTTTPWTP